MRFLICDVLGQTDRRVQIPLGRTPQRLPDLLSRAEVAALLGATTSIKARTFLMVAYASGLRLSELCHLRGRASAGWHRIDAKPGTTVTHRLLGAHWNKKNGISRRCG